MTYKKANNNNSDYRIITDDAVYKFNIKAGEAYMDTYKENPNLHKINSDYVKPRSGNKVIAVIKIDDE